MFGEIFFKKHLVRQEDTGWSLLYVSTADSTGAFFIGNSYEGRILFTFRSIGYKNLRKVDYSYGKEVSDTIDLGLIKLQLMALMLQEVEVTAKIPRITMSGDTIVFNPEAFKLKEGARLTDLIKNLPGVENRNGKLYWNNKPIRLMMNGKDLFGGDEIVDQLPAEVAAKLKLHAFVVECQHRRLRPEPVRVIQLPAQLADKGRQ